MITQKEINNACEHLKIVATVSDDLIEFMREASYQKLMSEENGIDKDVEMLNKKFGIKAMSEIAQKCIGTGIGIDDVANFVKYRNKIKKPLKTERPLKMFIDELIKIKDAGYEIKASIESCVDEVKENKATQEVIESTPKEIVKEEIKQISTQIKKGVATSNVFKSITNQTSFFAPRLIKMSGLICTSTPSITP